MRLFSKVLSLVFLVATISAHAALPPLSQEMRESMATDIVSGVVVSSTSRIHERRPGMTNMIYSVVIEVTSASKGGLLPGQTINVTYWQGHERPDGWCGPGGQYGVMHEGASVTAYMTLNMNGTYSLLEPNGFDIN